MSKISRRSIVASAAALPALAVPAVTQINNPDAKLIALGERLKVLMPCVAALGLKCHAPPQGSSCWFSRRLGDGR